MPYSSKNFAKSLPTNYGPLSVMIACGMPKHQMMFFHMKRSMTIWVVVVMGSASTHFCEVIDHYDHHASTPNSRLHWSSQVDRPLHEWLWARLRVEFAGR
ncbi:hypothetical protein ACFX12_043335 [Malus domestica]